MPNVMNTEELNLRGKTLREQFEEIIRKYPDTKNARNMLAFMSGYYGFPSAPCIDAGVFLIAFMNAIEDELLTWEEIE